MKLKIGETIIVSKHKYTLASEEAVHPDKFQLFGLPQAVGYLEKTPNDWSIYESATVETGSVAWSAKDVTFDGVSWVKDADVLGSLVFKHAILKDEVGRVAVPKDAIFFWYAGRLYGNFWEDDKCRWFLVLWRKNQ